MTGPFLYTYRITSIVKFCATFAPYFKKCRDTKEALSLADNNYGYFQVSPSELQLYRGGTKEHTTMLYTVTIQNPGIHLICLPNLPLNFLDTQVEKDIIYHWQG